MKHILVVAIVLALAVLVVPTPAVGQNPGFGLGIHWQILLGGEAAKAWALADYDVLSVPAAPQPVTSRTLPLYKKFTVEATTPGLPDGTKLGVFIGPSTSANEPYGKLVGIIDVREGAGGMILLAGRVPSVHKGTTVTVDILGSTPTSEHLILTGTF
jgi:hypothetical protein